MPKVLLRKEIYNNWQNCALVHQKPTSKEYTFLKVSAVTGLEEYVLTKDLHLYPKGD
jgi:hypothetical protein